LTHRFRQDNHPSTAAQNHDNYDDMYPSSTSNTGMTGQIYQKDASKKQCDLRTTAKTRQGKRHTTVVVFSSKQINKFRTTSRKQRTSTPTRISRYTYQKSVGVRLGSTASLELLRDTLQDAYSVLGGIKILSSASFIMHRRSPSSP
jgi:hypothetical protein